MEISMPEYPQNSNWEDTAEQLGNSSRNGSTPRATNACDRCRKRKSKCSGTVPCEYCKCHSLPCLYTYVKKKRTNFKKSVKPTLDPVEASGHLPVVPAQELTIERLNANIMHLLQVNKNLIDRVVELEGKVEYLAERLVLFETGEDPAAESKDESESIPSERLIELVSSVNSSLIFAPDTLVRIKEVAGANFHIFKPVIDVHIYFLKRLSYTITHEFNNLKNYNDFFKTKKEEVKHFLRMFLRLHLKAFLVTDEQIISIFHRFYHEETDEVTQARKRHKPNSSHPLSNSEHLILFSTICIGCTYVSSQMHDGSTNHDASTPALEKKFLLDTLKSVLSEVERKSMKNCFYYFMKVMNHSEGHITVVSLAFLYLYLNSTMFSKFNYFILGYIRKHCKLLGYDKLSAEYVDNESHWIKTLVWFHCYTYDRDVASSLERPGYFTESETINELGFINLTRFYLSRFCKANGIQKNMELLALETQVFVRDAQIVDQKGFFRILHEFAKYDSAGLLILLYYYSYCISKLLTSYSKDVYLNNILRAAPKLKESIPKDKNYFGEFLHALDNVNELLNQFELWRQSLPANIRPGNKLDTSLYKVPTPGYSGLNFKSYDPNYKPPRFDDTDEDYDNGLPDREAANQISMAALTVPQIRYYYHLMTSHRVARKCCAIVLHDKQTLSWFAASANVDPDQVAKSLESRILTHGEISLTAARDILRLSIDLYYNHCHIIYWCMNYINGALFTILMDILNFSSSSILAKLKVHDVHLMIECYATCLLKSYFPSATIRQEVKDVFYRRLILLSLAHIKGKCQHDFLKDSKVLGFLKSIENHDDTELLNSIREYNNGNSGEEPPIKKEPESDSSNFYKVLDQYSNKSVNIPAHIVSDIRSSLLKEVPVNDINDTSIPNVNDGASINPFGFAVAPAVSGPDISIPDFGQTFFTLSAINNHVMNTVQQNGQPVSSEDSKEPIMNYGFNAQQEVKLLFSVDLNISLSDQSSNHQVESDSVFAQNDNDLNMFRNSYPLGQGPGPFKPNTLDSELEREAMLNLLELDPLSISECLSGLHSLGGVT